MRRSQELLEEALGVLENSLGHGKPVFLVREQDLTLSRISSRSSGLGAARVDGALVVGGAVADSAPRLGAALPDAVAHRLIAC
jgi:hypothetical protein